MSTHIPSGATPPVSSQSPSPSPAMEPELSRWQKIRLVIKVVELRVRFLALMAITGLVFGYWDTIWNHYEKWARPAGTHAAAASDVEYFCPMHPNVVRDHAANCPICGMPLSKRQKGEVETLPPGVTARVALSPQRVRQAGLKTVAVSYAPLTDTLTTVGEVRFDERRLARIASKSKGLSRVETLYVNVTGSPVSAGAPLAELYSPELSQAVRELILAQKTMAERARVAASTSAARSLLGEGTDLVRLAREKLSLWGLTPSQIDEILASGKVADRLPILSPISGVVIRKNVVQGQYVAEGDALFEVADLSRVWVQAQVFENHLGRIEVGQAVEATVSAFPGETFRGTVSFIDPALDPQTRTVNVRYDLDNPEGRLRPGMYARVTLRTPVSEMPAFRGRFAYRPAAKQGQVRLASMTADEQEICPVTRAKLGSMGAPLSVEVSNEKVWLCCDGCTDKIKAEPSRYLSALAPAPEGAVLSVPESAVIDTGLRKIVYVETEPGTFEGRVVVLGPRSGDRYAVLEGLHVGDRVASSGSFLIDAESRLNPGAAVPAAESDPNPKSAPEPAHDHGPAVASKHAH